MKKEIKMETKEVQGEMVRKKEAQENLQVVP